MHLVVTVTHSQSCMITVQCISLETEKSTIEMRSENSTIEMRSINQTNLISAAVQTENLPVHVVWPKAVPSPLIMMKPDQKKSRQWQCRCEEITRIFTDHVNTVSVLWNPSFKTTPQITMYSFSFMCYTLCKMSTQPITKQRTKTQSKQTSTSTQACMRI